MIKHESVPVDVVRFPAALDIETGNGSNVEVARFVVAADLSRDKGDEKGGLDDKGDDGNDPDDGSPVSRTSFPVTNRTPALKAEAYAAESDAIARASALPFRRSSILAAPAAPCDPFVRASDSACPA
eukprot:CAMPEP_0171994246 /NCGR_PEP_ID=MMETSP0993-20121228/278860_1 /TAXON_ID=483369 /ORGANISM="non described non described, Strain CCMP2098" /LENGTH=126 /DNA_ID=CAMNT_0012647321 /DNA_START=784 /DNA_END=1165 /DNA_ORIENTATION=+